MKSLFVEVLSEEQFDFLKKRQIHKGVGITQEVMHSIKVRKLEALILKVDMIKAYNRVNWTFLRLILLQIGLTMEIINLIMECVSIAKFCSFD